jgi:hypothetical protein
VRRFELAERLKCSRDVAVPVDGIAVEVEDALKRITEDTARQVASELQDNVVLRA